MGASSSKLSSACRRRQHPERGGKRQNRPGRQAASPRGPGLVLSRGEGESGSVVLSAGVGGVPASLRSLRRCAARSSTLRRPRPVFVTALPAFWCCAASFVAALPAFCCAASFCPSWVHRTAPHRTAPHRTAPHRTAHNTTHHTRTTRTPQGTIQHRTTPHCTESSHTTHNIKPGAFDTLPSLLEPSGAAVAGRPASLAARATTPMLAMDACTASRSPRSCPAAASDAASRWVREATSAADSACMSASTVSSFALASVRRPILRPAF